MPHRNQSDIPKGKNLEPRLDITPPFMDDIGVFVHYGNAGE